MRGSAHMPSAGRAGASTYDIGYLSWIAKCAIVVKSGFNSPYFPHIKTVSNVSFETVFGTPDWIRTSGLQSRSYQAVKPESTAAQEFGGYCTNFQHLGRTPRSPCGARAPRFFIVVVCVPRRSCGSDAAAPVFSTHEPHTSHDSRTVSI